MAKRKNDAELLRIGDVATLVGVSASTLRNWEKMGLLTATRTESGYRMYSRAVVEQLKQIQYLRKSKRINIPGIQLQRERDPESGPLLAPEWFLPELPERLATLRRQKGLKLTEVARRTGVAPTLLSAIEHGHAVPTVAVVQKLAEVYETNVMSFFTVEDTMRKKVLRRKDRPILRFGPGVRMELLAFGATMMEPHLVRIAPRTTSGGSYSHQGEELLYMLQGKLEVWLDEIERYVLGPGDSLYFHSTQSHRWSSLTDRECVLVWINAPVTF